MELSSYEEAGRTRLDLKGTVSTPSR